MNMCVFFVCVEGSTSFLPLFVVVDFVEHLRSKNSEVCHGKVNVQQKYRSITTGDKPTYYYRFFCFVSFFCTP